MIKVFIPTYNRQDTIKSHKLFISRPDLFDLKVVVHTEQQKQEYINCNQELKDKMLVSNAKNGIAGQRDFIDSQLAAGEWYVSADDDIESITSVVPAYYLLPELPTKLITKANYGMQLDTQEIYELFQKFIDTEDTHKATLYGFATNDNIFFRAKKISDNSFIIGQLFLEKKLANMPKSKVKLKEDYERTANHILLSGRVVRNNFIRPTTKMYSKGGVGSKESRQEELKIASKTLIEHYSGLFVPSINKPQERETEISMPLRTELDIARWRLKMILQGKLGKEYVYEVLKKEKAEQFIKKYNL